MEYEKKIIQILIFAACQLDHTKYKFGGKIASDLQALQQLTGLI